LNLSFSRQEEEFRAEVQSFLEPYQNLDGFFGQGLKWAGVRDLFLAMGERGWLGLCWPERWGGLGKGPAWEFILWDEVAYARAARNPLSSGIVARTLIRHGSDAQKADWLPGIRSGQSHFSLAYSEPEAGSDLASLRLRADREGDFYRVNGQKCWQSYAQDMDCFWLLARTGTPESRGRGLSLFICEKERPGVSLAPLPTLDGDQLNEVLFEDVLLPASHRVGPENGAWSIMGEALADERHIQFPPARVRRDLEELLTWVRERGLSGDAELGYRLTELTTEVAEVEMHALLVLDAMQKGRSAGALAAANKLAHTRTCQAIARTWMSCGGSEALLEGSRASLLWRHALWESIGGGTTEIMRGIVAREALQLGEGRR
jgi:alkylation response protein AidB-like acyl-CoA dehydrogenase